MPMPARSAPESVSKNRKQTKFLIDLQDRLLKIVEDHAAEVMMSSARYIPAVLRGYHTGKHRLVQPEPGSVRQLPRGRDGQVFRTTRFSAFYPTDTTEWLDAVGEQAGGFNRSHCVIMLLLDWFGISPFTEVLALKRGTLGKDLSSISANTSMSNRIKSSFTAQSRLLKLIRKAADPTAEQQYMRTILVSYVRGEERAFRPQPGTVPKLSKGRAGQEFEKETIGFYFGPDLLRWIDDLSDRAGGFNRSHTMLLLFLDWLHINPFLSSS
jgi:hypothetical protein